MAQVQIAGRWFWREECFKCGVEFAMPHSYREALYRDGGAFYCPNGHGQHYTENLRNVLEKTKRDRDEALAARDKVEAELARVRTRVKGGTCAFCKRHFQNVQRHMQSKHPA